MKPEFYIKDVRLQNYATVKNVAIDFVQGLNIIIGKNAVGKTNFMNFLHSALNLDFDKYSNVECEYEWHRGKAFEKWHIKRSILGKNGSQIKTEPQTAIAINGSEKDENYTSLEDIFTKRPGNFFFFSDFLHHSIHMVQQPFLDIPFSTNAINDLFNEYRNRNDLSYFIRALIVKISFRVNLFEFKREDAAMKEYLLSLDLVDFFSYKNLLKELTVIEDFKFNNDFNIFFINNKVGIRNLFFEFLVEGNWIPYSSLSDGTRRMFNIIIDIACKDKYMTTKGFWGYGDDIYRILLIEEPELGVHPHELKKLMQFIESESQNKQIILTTHSPDVLDILDKDNLQRIIIAEYDNEKGTQLRHLTSEEKRKSMVYLQNEAFLSDYWKHSTLER